MKHAPAPWGIGFASGDSKVQIISADGYHLAYVEQDPIYPNARLMIASPDLLEALKELMREQQPLRGGTIGERHPLQTAREKAVAAIAKAEGGNCA